MFVRNYLTVDRNIILALDTDDKDKCMNIARLVREQVYAFKVGYPMLLNHGLSVLDSFSEMGKIIVDIKIADIPDVSREIAKMITSHGAIGVIVQGFIGRDSIKAVRGVVKELFVVAEMSHPGSLDYISPQSEKIAIMASELRADGLVAPATRPERIKVLKNISGLSILSPGVGTQGGSYDEAIKNGADYVIIGRSIMLSQDPLQKINEFYSGRSK